MVLQAFSDVYDMGGSEKRDPNKPPRWVPDDNVLECTACKDVFNLVRRKHHCRACGGIFCAKCSSGALPLPKYDMTKNVRVCDTCFSMLSAELSGEKVRGGEKENQTSSSEKSDFVKMATARSPRQSPPPRSRDRKERSRSRGKVKSSE